MTSLAQAFAFAVAVAGVLVWRWMSIHYPATPSVTLNADEVQKKLAEHESRLNALYLRDGLRPTRETRA